MNITNTFDEVIDHTHAKSESHERRANWIVILGHGVTGNKDRDLLIDTAETLQARGFDTLRISFSGNGESDGAFTACTVSKEVQDLRSVVDAAAEDYDHIAYIGHSMGAAVGVLATANDARIQLLVSLAGMVDTKKFALTEFGELEPGKDCMWDERDCPLVI
ncbi:MAG: alpha/beta fold hydrolase [Opitutales bacterium]|nr:alpha/beta fold hydrolase [Opitutales bacterium]